MVKLMVIVLQSLNYVPYFLLFQKFLSNNVWH